MMTEVSFSEVVRALEDVALPDCQLVVGIANGGIIPATLAAYKLGCDLKIVPFNYRNEQNIPQHPEPILLSKVSLPKNIKSILLVDDVTVSGKTLNAAKKLFQDYQVSTMVFTGEAEYVLFPRISGCVRWPWEL